MGLFWRHPPTKRKVIFSLLLKQTVLIDVILRGSFTLKPFRWWSLHLWRRSRSLRTEWSPTCRPTPGSAARIRVATCRSLTCSGSRRKVSTPSVFTHAVHVHGPAHWEQSLTGPPVFRDARRRKLASTIVTWVWFSETSSGWCWSLERTRTLYLS